MRLDECARKFARDEIVLDRAALALARFPIAARARRLDHDRLVRRHFEVRGLGRQRNFRAAAQSNEPSGAAAAAAEQAPWPMHEALALAGERHRMADRDRKSTRLNSSHVAL